MSGTCEKHGDFPGFRCVECSAPVQCEHLHMEIDPAKIGRPGAPPYRCIDCGASFVSRVFEKMAEERMTKAQEALEAARQEVPQAPRLGDCLDEAKATICGERQDQYGNPEDSFALVGAYWATYLQEKAKDGTVIISAKDVAHMMILFKVARCQGQTPKRDNYVDICGYAAIAADRLMEEK